MATIGRPSDYTPEITDRVCEELMAGKSLIKICEAEDMPDRGTVVRWMNSNPDFASKCARAREEQAEFMDDLILDAANACDEDNAQSTRVKISAYQWRAMKLKPKKYGDKIQQDIDATLRITITDPSKPDV